jgi:hypothetical protein
MSIDSIELWHKRARPSPTPEDFAVQLGCHIEEFVEMLDTLMFSYEGGGFNVAVLATAMTELGEALKRNEVSVRVANRKEFLDSVADQIVTAVGVGYCAGMKTVEGVDAVSRSNWSKFDDEGFPIFNSHGKITKGPKYRPPVLDNLY